MHLFPLPHPKKAQWDVSHPAEESQVAMGL